MHVWYLVDAMKSQSVWMLLQYDDLVSSYKSRFSVETYYFSLEIYAQVFYGNRNIFRGIISLHRIKTRPLFGKMRFLIIRRNRRLLSRKRRLRRNLRLLCGNRRFLPCNRRLLRRNRRHQLNRNRRLLPGNRRLLGGNRRLAFFVKTDRGSARGHINWCKKTPNPCIKRTTFTGSFHNI